MGDICHMQLGKSFSRHTYIPVSIKIVTVIIGGCNQVLCTVNKVEVNLEIEFVRVTYHKHSQQVERCRIYSRVSQNVILYTVKC